ncbi:MAG: hypothetical protein HDR43_02580 [Mycoplasma sp.]|nr:hypothetical protein [Mycoplasma sp.]
MSRGNRKRRFDYYIDGYDDLSYLDNNYDDNDDYYYEDERQHYMPSDRFQKTNRYTGSARGSHKFVEGSNVIYGNQMRNNGTIEFSAIPGQGGLNPNRRPLGDETLMFSNTSSYDPYAPSIPSTNPHIARMLETQQLQLNQSQAHQDEIDKKMDNINYQMSSLAERLEDVSKNLANQQYNTSTLSFNNNANEVPMNNGFGGTSTTYIPNNVNNPAFNTNEIESGGVKSLKTKKLSKLALTGIIIWVLIILATIVFVILLFLGIIKIS